jgi:hypothetical protein
MKHKSRKKQAERLHPIVIDRDHMFEPMLVACPSFVEAWNNCCEDAWAFSRELGENSRELPIYGALSELASHLIEKIETGDTKKFPTVFDVIERWHIEGDAFVQLAAAVGLLETVKLADGAEEKPWWKEFRSWLKPVSRLSWDGIP